VTDNCQREIFHCEAQGFNTSNIKQCVAMVKAKKPKNRKRNLNRSCKGNKIEVTDQLREEEKI
jgi:hypothetical protein